MTISTSEMEVLKELLEHDSVLIEKLGNASTRPEFTDILASAAAAKGLDIGQVELNEFLDQACAKYAESLELTDEQLEDVTGGLMLSVAVGSFLVSAALGFVGGMLGVGLYAGGVFDKKS